MFYTYLWLREDGSPYYVGKGHGDRAYQNTKKHRPPTPDRIRLQNWSDEGTAFAYEKYLIDFWGRKDLGTGILINLTDGGQGPSGIRLTDARKKQLSDAAKRKPPVTEATRKKQSLAKLGKPSPRKGATLSKETRIKIGLGSRGREDSEETTRRRRESQTRSWANGRRHAAAVTTGV